MLAVRLLLSSKQQLATERLPQASDNLHQRAFSREEEGNFCGTICLYLKLAHLLVVGRASERLCNFSPHIMPEHQH